MLPAPVVPPEPFKLPDVRRPEQMPSWPAWAALPFASLTDEVQPNAQRKWRTVPTLPAPLTLKAAEREAIEQHLAALEGLLSAQPSRDLDQRTVLLAAIAKMLISFPSAAISELAAEARGEAYLDALEDIPIWAVEAGIRNWNRGHCGINESGKPYDYRWPPAPAELRRIAVQAMWPVRQECRNLRRLLEAEIKIEFSEEHCTAMLEKLTVVLGAPRTSPVGRNGSGGVTGSPPVKVPTVGHDQGTARPQA